jgi:hypothetical protein
MTSVERQVYYLYNLPQEPPRQIPVRTLVSCCLSFPLYLFVLSPPHSQSSLYLPSLFLRELRSESYFGCPCLEIVCGSALFFLCFQHILMHLSPQATKPPADWPSQGAVSFENVTMRYRADLPPCIMDGRGAAAISLSLSLSFYLSLSHLISRFFLQSPSPFSPRRKWASLAARAPARAPSA